jgi:ABC-2 type transport system ATP-binding protein
MQDVVLRTQGLTKHFGDFVAVDHLNLEIRRGEVLGFLGPNGSGKSTTVGMILGLVRPTAGVVDRLGIPLRRIGAIIESPAFYPFLSGRDNLRALALAVNGVGDEAIERLLDLVGLTAAAHRKYQTYSLGMKQRLGIASTLLCDPEVVILDEPTNGLDPAGQQEICALIPRLAGEGRSVLLASHLLFEVEQVCDRVAILQRGKLVTEGLVKELIQQQAFLEIGVDDLEKASDLLNRLESVRNVRIENGLLHVDADASSGSLITKTLADAGIYVSSLSQHHTSLEDVFLELTSESGAGN